MEARNRKLVDWYSGIKQGKIKLPRFQRFEAWDRQRISSLLETVITNLPLGITLILEVGDKEKFVSRYLITAPETENRVHEHLLDGQQRLTALWRAFYNNYEHETFFIYLGEFDRRHEDADRDEISVFYKGRYMKNEARYPLWCDKPQECLKAGMIPTHLLRPEDIQIEIEEWIKAATNPLKPESDGEKLEEFFEFRGRLKTKIMELRSTVANYNLPYLSLPSTTEKTVALNVFINMNTNSKPLSQYDIIVAEVESIVGQSIHDLEAGLDEEKPEISRYFQLSQQILLTSALMQNCLPNKKGAFDMDKEMMVENWDTMSECLSRMAGFLESEGVYDNQRLPTNAVLAVISSLYAYIPESGDKRGQDELLLKRYLWHSFFTDRYEFAAATHAFSDFIALRRILTGECKANGSPYGIEDVPIFADHEFVEAEEFLTVEWPKGATIRGRGILAVACRLGALDFQTGEHLNVNTIEKRHYHHIYPDSLLKEAEIRSFLALNCALISDKTNMSIGRKDPLEYLKDRYEWTSEVIVRERLQSHLIPIEELANGGYEGLSEEDKNEKLASDFDAFIRKRAEYIHKAARILAEGRQLSPAEIYGE